MIGVIGGYGTIGAAVVGILRKTCLCPEVKVGGRNASSRSENAAEVLPWTTWQDVDATDVSSIEAFARGCSTVIDCHAGPGDVVGTAHAVGRSGGNFVAMGAPAVLPDARDCGGMRACYGAGSSPGLSGLLQTYAARSLDSVDEIVCCYEAVGALSPASAEAIVDGMFREQRPGFWHDGTYLRCSASSGFSKISSFFHEGSRFFPIMDDEARAVARSLGARSGAWLSSVGGVRARAAARDLPSEYLRCRSRAAALFAEAMNADAREEGSRVSYIVRAFGLHHGKPVCREIRCAGEDPSLLTAAAVAAAASSIDHSAEEPAHRMLRNSRTGAEMLGMLAEGRYLKSIDTDEGGSLLALPLGSSVETLNEIKE